MRSDLFCGHSPFRGCQRPSLRTNIQGSYLVSIGNGNETPIEMHYVATKFLQSARHDLEALFRSILIDCAEFVNEGNIETFGSGLTCRAIRTRVGHDIAELKA